MISTPHFWFLQVQRTTLESQLETLKLETRSKADCIKAMKAELLETKRKFEVCHLRVELVA